MLAANNWNVVQYAVLVYMFAQVSDMEPGELVHVIANILSYFNYISSHIYSSQIDNQVPYSHFSSNVVCSRPSVSVLHLK